MEKQFTELKYTLTFDEVKNSLYATDKLKPHKSKSITQSVLAGIAILLFSFNIMANPSRVSNYFILIACLALIPFVWIAPIMIEKRIINGVMDGKELRLELTNDFIAVFLDNDVVHWEAFPNGRNKLIETSDLFIIAMENNRLLVIPKRAIAEDDNNTVAVCLEKFK